MSISNTYVALVVKSSQVSFSRYNFVDFLANDHKTIEGFFRIYFTITQMEATVSNLVPTLLM